MILHSKIESKNMLTKIWNEFQYKVQHSYVENEGFVVFLDVNNMKAINDNYGHLAGDRVIKRVSYLLATSVSEDSRIVKFGGDEFIVFIPALNKQKIKDLLSALQERIEKDKYLRIRYSLVNLSMGVATLTKNDKRNMTKVIEEADMLMYAAKCNAPSYMVFDDDKGLDKYKDDRRIDDCKAIRRRSYFAWIISVILKEETDAQFYQPVIHVIVIHNRYTETGRNYLIFCK